MQNCTLTITTPHSPLEPYTRARACAQAAVTAAPPSPRSGSHLGRCLGAQQLRQLRHVVVRVNLQARHDTTAAGIKQQQQLRHRTNHLPSAADSMHTCAHKRQHTCELQREHAFGTAARKSTAARKVGLLSGLWQPVGRTPTHLVLWAEECLLVSHTCTAQHSTWQWVCC
jgi:hypothetical protein